MLISNSLVDPDIVKQLRGGAVGILPTDTVYGLVCVAGNETAVARLYGIKSREPKPGTIIAANLQQLSELGIKLRYLKAAEQFWPGRISVIIPCGSELEYLHLGLFSLAIRLTDSDELNALLLKTGPLLTTSANHSNQPTANDVKEAQAYFNGHVDFYADGGNLSGHAPSTIIRIVDDVVEVLRPGAATIDPETGEVKK